MTVDATYDLFLSYADADRAWAEGYLLDALRQVGVRVHSEQDFSLGVPRMIELERAVLRSRLILVILSPAYIADTFMQFSNLLAQTYGIEQNTWPVVPLMLHAVDLPLRLSLLSALDAANPADWPGVVARLCAILQRPGPPAVPAPACPYPGMVSFQEQDSARFFGRARETQELLEIIRLYPFLMIIGPSGSGKSSLVFAGLLPALRQSGLFAGTWLFRSMRPAATPLANLGATIALDPESDTGSAAMAQAVDGLLAHHHAAYLLVVIDQFEELFTLAQPEAAAFQDMLLRLTAIDNCAIILTARADFYPDLMTAPLWPTIQAHRYEVVPLDGDALRQAIVEPAQAKSIGVYLEATLVERLLSDAAGEPGALPLIQETLVLLWEKLERRFLPLRAYHALASPQTAIAIGRNGRTILQVAIARRADAALFSLPADQQIIARRIFLRLIQFGEGRSDTRRQQSITALQATGDQPARFRQTLQLLAERRLLTLDGAAEHDISKVDIAHEALITGWPTLQEWVIRRREAEQTRRRLEAKALEWDQGGRRHAALLAGAALAEAQRWRSSADAAELGVSDALAALLQRSTASQQLRGALTLLAVGVNGVALIALFYLQSTLLPTAIRNTIWLCIALLGLLLFVAVNAIRWIRPSFGQDVLRWMANQAPQAAVLLLSLATAGLWAQLGVRSVGDNAYCSARNYQLGGDAAQRIAIHNQGLDPYYAQVLGDALSSYGSIRAQVVASEDLGRCAHFFTHILTLQRLTTSVDSSIISYNARLQLVNDDALPAASLIPALALTSASECGVFAGYAQQIATRILPSSSSAFAPLSADACRPITLNNAGFTLYQAQSNQEATIDFLKAILLRANFATPHYNLGLVYLREHTYADAVSELQQARDLAPGDSLILTSLGSACHLQGDHACAEHSYKQAIEADPNYLVPYNNLAVFYRENKQYADSEAVLRQAQRLLPQIASPADRSWYGRLLAKNLGILAFDQKHWAEAIELLNSTQPRGWYYEEEIAYYLAASHTALGDTDAACTYWQWYATSPSQGLPGEAERQTQARQYRQNLKCP